MTCSWKTKKKKKKEQSLGSSKKKKKGRARNGKMGKLEEYSREGFFQVPDEGF